MADRFNVPGIRFRLDARPLEAETHRVIVHGQRQIEIFLIAVIGIAGLAANEFVGIFFIFHELHQAGHRPLPDAPIVNVAAFDLISRGGRAPEKSGRKFQGLGFFQGHRFGFRFFINRHISPRRGVLQIDDQPSGTGFGRTRGVFGQGITA